VGYIVLPLKTKAMTDKHRENIITGDALSSLKELPAESVHCCVTSPPYWGLRDYGTEGQLGLEKTPEQHVAAMVEIFREVRRVLRGDGTLWLNYGDSYATQGGPRRYGSSDNGTGRGDAPSDNRYPPPGLKPKDLVGMPWRVAFALQSDGWWLRSDIIWHKPNPMPESCTDRPTKSHEYMFLLAKSARYFYDADAVREAGCGYGSSENFRCDKYSNNQAFDNSRDWRGTSKGGGRNSYDGSGRNLRDVWTIATKPYPSAHFATFPPKLIEPCIKAGCPEGGTVLDPFLGSGTTAEVCRRLGRDCVGIEINPEYVELAQKRLAQGVLF
jgi:DNA modification methylase